MENKKLISVGFLMGILVLSVLSIGNYDEFVLESEDLIHPNLAATRSPIFINGNSGFTTENGVSAGDGTFEDPYIIENWVINPFTVDGIRIHNTNAYVIVRNCTIKDGRLFGNKGIQLFNAQNAIVENNTITNNDFGIYLSFSSNNTITQNNASKNKEYGINLYESNNNTITQNNASNNNNGIYLYESNNNTITQNNASNNYNGIYLYESNNNTITHNNASNNRIGIILYSSSKNNTIIQNIASNNNNGIFLSFSSNNTFQNNIMEGNGFSVESSSNNTVGTSNKVNGKSVRYFENQNGITLSGETDVGEVILVNSNSSLIENLDISNTSFGIQLSHSHNNSVINNNASNNKLYGIFLQSSSNNTITQNNASYNNYHGISLATSSNNNTIWNNTFKNNELYEAYCQNSNGNKWFYEQTGNYYGNYTERYPSATNDGRVWNTSYQIYGNAGDEDLFPIVELGGMVEIPSNTPNPPILNSIESPSPTGNITLSWNSVFGAESYKIYRSTSTITDVSSLTSIISGHPTTAYTDQSLTNGTYYYVVVATNASGNSGISNCESVIVQIVIQEPEPNSDDTDDDPNDDEYEILGFPILPLLLSITFAARILVKKQRTH